MTPGSYFSNMVNSTLDVLANHIPTLENIGQTTQPLYQPVNQALEITRNTAALRIIENYPLADHVFNGPVEVPSFDPTFLLVGGIVTLIAIGIGTFIYINNRHNRMQQNQMDDLNTHIDKTNTIYVREQQAASRERTDNLPQY